MGEIGGEELMPWEKIQGPSMQEEKILVLVRLRPLSEKEISVNEVADWECINDTTILFRNSLQERSMFPTAYSFDRVFRGDCSTNQVYEEGVKEIALSVVGGINSSIFAYGQTSSGKTYTMIGITEYTVSDIYDYISKHQERAFVLKFSAIEIYNEAVRDLLSTDATPLRILDDPEKGTLVENLTEEMLRDWSHLKQLLSICEAQRRIGETSLNETSSRSHQILRLTIESSAREFLGKEKSSTLAASVNFVDLAGSERASQALSAGQRLKEGCHINRSLLTLGTVIRKLSKGKQGHVNYRDSKLTRILQPSLGGNARTAIICTLSPARSHVEQSRNTLLFACCAKEVSTNAKVNVVMSDKALVKHLQKEVARLESELRSPGSGCDYGALLRKKDLQIEKLEKEVKELTKQRDLAQSRVEDLLRSVGDYEAPSLWTGHNHTLECQEGDTGEDERSISELSDRINPHHGARKLNINEYSISDNSCSSPVSIALRSGGDPDLLCKEVRCIETGESNKNSNFDPHSSSTGENEEGSSLTVFGNRDFNNQEIMSTPLNGDREVGQIQTGISGTSSPQFSDLESNEIKTPSNGFEKDFSGRPEGLRRKFSPLNYDADNARLLRNDSQTSIGSASIDELKAKNNIASVDEDINTIHTFVAELKEMAKLEYEKQLLDSQVEATEAEGMFGRSVKDVGVGPMQDGLENQSEWQLEFERQRREVIELWQSCNISLVHRTYFFLLFKGDPADSIYMEVELRRLSFLKQTFSQRNQALESGQTLNLASSDRALRREREMLSKLMYKRLSEEERMFLYRKWNITLDSKKRRLQLTHRLWSDPKDMNHIMESAVIIAKLVRFFEQGRALKEMFGLSFAHPSTRRTHGWKQSMGAFL